MDLLRQAIDHQRIYHVIAAKSLPPSIPQKIVFCIMIGKQAGRRRKVNWRSSRHAGYTFQPCCFWCSLIWPVTPIQTTYYDTTSCKFLHQLSQYIFVILCTVMHRTTVETK